MRTLNQNIQTKTILPIQVITATTNGASVDTYVSDKPAFDTALVDVAIGNLGDQTSTKVKIEEADVSDFSSGATITKGGEEVTVTADTVYKMQTERKKRYMRAVVTITGGAAPSLEVYIGAILWNAEKPFPLV
ncbi:hypothetical protein A3C29_05170 [Candidatus Daviesbacteria bacterium RIFCSPHIGHO2_02_FULL_40_16]|nr:MAG: hypothetical protein UX97_C0011G0001 [Candidatus Beckwithbacteria bacterium GW2011_GWA2_47_25]OGE29532.1 MAG: hypothetical protein A3C29_05170 [Candidatus Daviesbacteria bacterium RIFCSPHIGHO2_02_FULL_40_16]